ncbi:MAG: hypothetical protein HKN67_03390 [Saprospiraceae bacterium]|nr:hypothetical protein [Bacteroidia bacterium]MBT8228660.1 hypothetical protein [Bacteroidia bacterium]NNF20961.1 hypothetical protein [Saprospiraceae bacterium]
MLKILFLIALVYFSFRIFSTRKMLDNSNDYLQEEETDEYTEYEEIE